MSLKAPPQILPVVVEPRGCEDCQVTCSAHITSAEFCPMITREFADGAELFAAGSKADYLWLVKSGAVAGTYGPGREVHVMHLPGSFVGLEALSGAPHATTTWTLSPTVLCGMSQVAFDGWLAERVELRQTLESAARELVAAANKNGD